MYTVDKLRFLLRNYRTLAMGARLPTRGDTLGARTPPRDEAPTAFRSTEKADLECAMRTLPFETMQVVFMVVCQGESQGGKKYDHRRRVIEWWGFDNDDGHGNGHFSGGDLTKMVDGAVQEMCDYLNAGAAEFTHGENSAETSEHATELDYATQFTAMTDAKARELAESGKLV